MSKEEELEKFKLEITNNLEVEKKRVMDKYRIKDPKELKTDTKETKIAKQKIRALDVAIDMASHPTSDIKSVLHAVNIAKVNSKSTGQYFGAISRFLNSKLGLFKSDGEKNIETLNKKVNEKQSYFKYTRAGK